MKVERLEQSSKLVRETPVGREVKLDIFRNGAPLTIIAKVGEHPRFRAYRTDSASACRTCRG